MTREEAKKWLESLRIKDFGWDDYAMQESQTEIRERCENALLEAIDMAIEALSADTVDCTDFINWLTEEVMYEEMWELNAVAYGEIICRKLEKIGVLEVTEEPSYYIRPSAEAVSREAHYDAVANRITDMEERGFISVVRCKDCRHRDLFSCPLADNDFQKDEDFCSWGERREP